MHFDVRLLQRVPYEGVSRMQTSVRFATTTNCFARAPPARLLTLRTPPLPLHSFAVGTVTASCAAASA